MKFNLYIPHVRVLEKWQIYADQDKRSVSDFIRIAVEEKIDRMEAETK